MRSVEIFVVGFLVVGCGSSVDADGTPATDGDGSTSGSSSTTGGSDGQSTGSQLACGAIEDPTECDASVGPEGLQACAWAEVQVYLASDDQCQMGSREQCIELNQSPAEGCAGWACLGESDNVFYRPTDDGAIQIVAGPYCGNEPEGFSSCAAEDRPLACDCRCQGGAPEMCRDDPSTDECRDMFARYCEELTAEDACREAIGFELDGREIRCTWLTPTRWTLDGDDMCQAMPEPGQCVAGDFVGEGGSGCNPRWDPSDDGAGAVIGSADDCASPYEWSPCDIGATPPECDCAG